MTSRESSEINYLKKVYVLDSQNESEPEFTNPEIEWLYCNDIDIEQEKLQAILSLPREPLISDLKKVINDSIRRYEYFRELSTESDDFFATGSWFPIHATALLGELGASEAIESLVEILKQEEPYIEFWFGDLFFEFFWEVLYKTGSDNSERLPELVWDQKISYQGRLVVLDCLEQIGHHQPERREEVTGWFQHILRSIATNQLDSDLINSDFPGMAVWCVLNLAYSELLPEIEEMYEKGYALPGTCGTFEEVKNAIIEPYTGIGKQILMNIFDRYSEISKFLSDDSIDDEDDFDEDDFDEDDFDDFDDVQTDPFYSSSEPYIAPLKPGRNDPCVCGSGKKYKKCCILKLEN